VVTTLHTVLLKPNADQHRVMRKLIAYSDRLVVMTERGRAILRKCIRRRRPRSISSRMVFRCAIRRPDHYKDQFGVRGMKVLLTFGLLSPNKGIEHVLRALPTSWRSSPTSSISCSAPPTQRVAHARRNLPPGLEAIVGKNRLENNVIFHNRFVELKELTEFIGAADLYITPYLDEAQITSGTLAYAFGRAKP